MLSKGFETDYAYERHTGGPRLPPTAEEYDTVGHLYRGIEDGFRMLAKTMGEQALFLGNPQSQVGSDILSLPGLTTVTNLGSAIVAISTIVERGEGGRQDAEKSHYMHFCAIRDEYDAFLKEDPGFRPYRPVACDPVMFRPIADQGQVNGQRQLYNQKHRNRKRHRGNVRCEVPCCSADHLAGQ